VIDHIIYADPNLHRAVQKFAAEYKIEPIPGGLHPGFGTRNALIGLRTGAYLELLGIDDNQDVPPTKRPFGLDRGSQPGFVAWCARAERPLHETVAIARAAGLDLGEVFEVSRQRPDGSTRSGKVTSPFANRFGVLPFYIDRGDTPDPAVSSLPSLTLVSLAIVHPEADRMRAILDALGEDEVEVKQGFIPALEVQLRR